MPKSADEYRSLSMQYQFGIPPHVRKKSKSQRREERLRSELHNPHKVSPRIKRFALENIDNATKAERTLLNVLREVLPRHKLKVCFQYPAECYIVDFYIPRVRLAIEVDGPYHLFRGKKDAQRTRILRRAGIRVVRFTNEEVEADIPSVVHRILRACGSAYEQASC
jgi:very-short-patch-repair endonuclease